MAEASGGSSFSVPENDVVFNGHITPDFGRLVRQKRKSLGLSLRELGPLLGISWSTIHKWETGRIITCRPHHGTILLSFVTGKLDGRLAISKPTANVFAVTPDQSVLLYVQTESNRAVIAFPASSGTACASALQPVFDFINEQIEALGNVVQPSVAATALRASAESTPASATSICRSPDGLV